MFAVWWIDRPEAPPGVTRGFEVKAKARRPQGEDPGLPVK